MLLTLATAVLASPLLAATKPASQASATKMSAASKATTLHHRVLPFIEDDYPRALTEARASKKPIFIEAWAPW
jgi:hypothetical protein